MSASSIFNNSEENFSTGHFEESGANEYQDVCKFCYSFKNYCKCAESSDEDILEEREKHIKRIDNLRLCPVQLITYSAPTHFEEIRRGAEVEEYCLKSRYKYRVPPKESRAIITNLYIQRRNGEMPRKLEVKNRIKSDWLNETFNEIFISKAGVVSPAFTGDLAIKIFNKSCEEIIIEEGSPVGVLQSRPYEYE